MIWFKLGLLLAAVMGIAGIVHTHDVEQREKGAAEVRAQVAETKAAQEARNADLARKAQATAERAATTAIARWKGIRQQLTQAELQRQAANEQLARKDAEYAAWRNQPLPRAVIDELRDIVAAGTDASRGGVSGRINVQAGAVAAALADDKRTAQGIRTPTP